jgi:ABC-type multidrug transport system ATPase subunit
LVLQVRNITKRYGPLTALSDVSFSVRHGEVLGLIGPNGSGKTTLFECLGGVLPADSGTVAVDGRALTADERADSVFYLPDAIAPWPSQTVAWARRFVTGFFARTTNRERRTSNLERRTTNPERRTPNAERRTSSDVVADLDLSPLLHARIGTLSKGQRKRALLAIGLLTPQPVLLADEPFDGLDLRQTRDVARTLRAHAARGRTIVLSIHQISDAARVCDRFVLLSGGRIRGEGTLDELASVAGRSDAAADLEEIFLALT